MLCVITFIIVMVYGAIKLLNWLPMRLEWGYEARGGVYWFRLRTKDWPLDSCQEDTE